MWKELRILLCALMVCFTLMLIMSCTSVKYVPINTVQTDSVFIRDTLSLANIVRYTDSLRIIDSVIIVQDTAGNQILKEKYHNETRTKTGKEDKSQVKKSDNITKSAGVNDTPVYIEKELNWWQKTCINIFPFLIVGVIILIFVLVYLAKKLIKKK